MFGGNCSFCSTLLLLAFFHLRNQPHILVLSLCSFASSEASPQETYFTAQIPSRKKLRATKGPKEGGFSNSPSRGVEAVRLLECDGEGKARCWLQNYPWPQEGGLRWHLFQKALYFGIRTSSTSFCDCAFPNSSQKHERWKIGKADLAVVFLLWFADQGIFRWLIWTSFA